MREKKNAGERLKSLRTFLVILAVAFVVVMAVIIGNRLSNDALAVLAGATCGVGAAIPTSLLIIAVTRWRSDNTTQSRQPQQNPSVIVVSPGDSRQYLPQSRPHVSDIPQQREWEETVIGN